MKKKLMIVAISLAVSTSGWADVCPSAQNINPQTPPGGWSLFLSPQSAGENYYFVSATLSLNSTYYPNQVFCHYESCPASNCPNFTLMSLLSYQSPSSNTAPWNITPTLVNTLVCAPANNDPQQCIFTS